MFGKSQLFCCLENESYSKELSILLFFFDRILYNTKYPIKSKQTDHSHKNRLQFLILIFNQPHRSSPIKDSTLKPRLNVKISWLSHETSTCVTWSPTKSFTPLLIQLKAKNKHSVSGKPPKLLKLRAFVTARWIWNAYLAREFIFFI